MTEYTRLLEETVYETELVKVCDELVYRAGPIPYVWHSPDDSHVRIGPLWQHMAAIQLATTIFAWVVDCKCAGVLLEIGIAKANGKKVVVATPSVESLYAMFGNEARYIIEIADHIIEGYLDPSKAFEAYDSMC